MLYVTVEVDNPWSTSCYVLHDGKWMIPNMSHDDFLAVKKEMAEEVVYLGDSKTTEIEGVPKPNSQYMTFLYSMTERAYEECQKLWSKRVGLARF